MAAVLRARFIVTQSNEVILVLGTESESVRSIGVCTSTAGPEGQNWIVMKILSSAPKKEVIAIEINRGPYHSS